MIFLKIRSKIGNYTGKPKNNTTVGLAQVILVTVRRTVQTTGRTVAGEILVTVHGAGRIL